MNRLQGRLSVALASVWLAVPALAQTTAPSTAPAGMPNTPPLTAAPGAGRPNSITPGNNAGTLQPSTTLGQTGAAPAVPGTTTNTPAQRSQDNTTSATPPSVTTSNANRKTAAAPVKGANSFTMAEARRRIEAGGFSQVTGLKKDRDGIWRGHATRDGAPVSVYCDYQGNVGAS